MYTHTTTFVGAGNMAASIAGGLINSGVDPASIIMSDPVAETRERVAADFSVKTLADNTVAVNAANIIVLAVKPDSMQAVCREIGPAIQGRPMIISIAAGVREVDMSSWLGRAFPVVRCMPNTPALLGLGATALYANSHCTTEERSVAEQLMRATGTTVWVESEPQLDTVTALSGSGPAYFFYLIECMIDAAESMGLPRSVAETLAIETAHGASAMARARQHPPARLRENVTSEGGTTAAALASFRQDQLPAIVQRAMQAASRRAQALGRDLGTLSE